MKGGQVPHKGIAQIGQRFTGQLVEVVDDLDGSGEQQMGGIKVALTLPLRVVAAKSFAAASTLFASSIPIVVVQASSYAVYQHNSPAPSLFSHCTGINVPTSGTAPNNGAPALSGRDPPPMT